MDPDFLLLNLDAVMQEKKDCRAGDFQSPLALERRSQMEGVVRKRLSSVLSPVLRLTGMMGRCGLAMLVFALAAPSVASAQGGGCTWSGEGGASGIGVPNDSTEVLVIVGITNLGDNNGDHFPCTYAFEGTDFVKVGRVFDAGVPSRSCCSFDTGGAFIGVLVSGCPNVSTQGRLARLVMKTTDVHGVTMTTNFIVGQEPGLAGPLDSLFNFQRLLDSIDRRTGKKPKFTIKTKSCVLGHRG